MSSGIYCIENLINGKKYIGQALDINKRIKTHLRNFKKKEYPQHVNKPLCRAVKKYGVKNFKIYTLKKCNPDKLDKTEEGFILKFHSLVSENGYNICSIGRSRKGAKNTDEQNKKISMANSGEKHYNYGKRGKETPHFGYVHSIKTRNLISKNAKGKQIGRKEIKSTSKYHGIYKKNHTVIKKGVSYNYIYWVAEIKNVDFRKVIGHFKKEMDAVVAYNEYVIKNKLKQYPLNLYGGA